MYVWPLSLLIHSAFLLIHNAQSLSKVSSKLEIRDFESLGLFRINLCSVAFHSDDKGLGFSSWRSKACCMCITTAYNLVSFRMWLTFVSYNALDFVILLWHKLFILRFDLYFQIPFSVYHSNMPRGITAEFDLPCVDDWFTSFPLLLAICWWLEDAADGKLLLSCWPIMTALEDCIYCC